VDAHVANSTKADHLPDIEGLRGIAVMQAFAVHSVPDVTRGGFIGIDVFFVLPGFLNASTALGVQDARQGFSATEFHVRRIRRLAPALHRLAPELMP
jgi:peptidoglycan/LPS O-acetylase OafA/YrhL